MVRTHITGFFERFAQLLAGAVQFYCQVIQTDTKVFGNNLARLFIEVNLLNY